MSDATHDIIVIGGGPGGYAAALYGAGAGLDVAVVEHNKVGGTCLHVGCIPAKELLETASVYRTVARAAEFGVTASQPGIDWPAVLGRKQRIIDQLTAGLTGLLGQRKVTVYSGSGSLRGPSEVEVVPDGGGSPMAVSAPSIILATGSAPRTIGGFEVDGRIVVTSDELFFLESLPASAAVIGGGAIGCEFASMMGDLGVDVIVLEALPTILAGCDADVAKVVRRSFRKRGIGVHTGVTVHGHEPRADGTGTVVSFGEGKQADVDLVVVAVGRRPRTEGLGLDAAGVAVDGRGFVEVDARCRTTVPGVWAVGTWSTPPSSPTLPSPRACSPSPTSAAKIPNRSTITARPGASTAIPRWPSPDTPSRARRMPDSRWSRRPTGIWATAGLRSSARPTAWSR